MSKRAFIFAAGEYKASDLKLYKRIKFKPDDLIICADGGYDSLFYTNIVPNVVIGDFDSLKSSIPKDIKNIRYPVNKDKTDLEICIDYAVSNGCDCIFLLGVLGGRFDHTVGALNSLLYAYEKKCEPMILSADTRVYITGDEIVIPREDFSHISLIPCTDKVSGVTVSGLKYRLKNADIYKKSSLGISNEFYNNEAVIKVGQGVLYVICTAL